MKLRSLIAIGLFVTTLLATPGHAAIGGIVVLLPPLARWAFLTAWLAKEMFLDALGCDLSPWVAADSVADILCAVIGFLLVSKLRQERLRYE